MTQKNTGPRRRTAVACDRCRRRKIRCTGSDIPGQPCLACQKAHADCHFSTTSWRACRKKSAPLHCPSTNGKTNVLPSYASTPSLSPMTSSHFPYASDGTLISAANHCDDCSYNPHYLPVNSNGSSPSHTSSLDSIPGYASGSGPFKPPYRPVAVSESSSRSSFSMGSSEFASSTWSQSPMQSSLYVSPSSQPLDRFSPASFPSKETLTSSSLSSSVPRSVSLSNFADSNTSNYPESSLLPAAKVGNNGFVGSNVLGSMSYSNVEDSVRFQTDSVSQMSSKSLEHLPMLSEMTLSSSASFGASVSPKSTPGSNSTGAAVDTNSVHSNGGSDLDYSSYLTDSSAVDSPSLDADEVLRSFNLANDPIGAVDPLTLEIDQGSGSQLLGQQSFANDSLNAKQSSGKLGPLPPQSFNSSDYISFDELSRYLSDDASLWPDQYVDKVQPLATMKTCNPAVFSSNTSLDDMFFFIRDFDEDHPIQTAY